MPVVLLVDADSDSSLRFQKAFESAGYEVQVASSGSDALAMVRQRPPSLVVSQSTFEDMYGAELCSDLKSDPATKAIMFILIVDRRTQMAHAASRTDADMILPDNLPPATMVTRIDTHIRLRGLPSPAPRPAAPAGAPAKGAKEAPAATLQGSLAVMDLTEVTQAVAIGRKSGRLVFTLKGGQGMVLFDGGRVMHAEFGGKKGEEAFAALVMAAHRERGGSFSFIPVEAEAVSRAPQTINKDLETLLLNIAVVIDEQERDQGR